MQRGAEAESAVQPPLILEKWVGRTIGRQCSELNLFVARLRKVVHSVVQGGIGFCYRVWEVGRTTVVFCRFVYKVSSAGPFFNV